MTSHARSPHRGIPTILGRAIAWVCIAATAVVISAVGCAGPALANPYFARDSTAYRAGYAAGPVVLLLLIALVTFLVVRSRRRKRLSGTYPPGYPQQLGQTVSQPPPPPPVSPPPGWYPDPAGAPGTRYWDGGQWNPNAPPPATMPAATLRPTQPAPASFPANESMATMQAPAPTPAPIAGAGGPPLMDPWTSTMMAGAGTAPPLPPGGPPLPAQLHPPQQLPQPAPAIGGASKLPASGATAIVSAVLSVLVALWALVLAYYYYEPFPYPRVVFGAVLAFAAVLLVLGGALLLSRQLAGRVLILIGCVIVVIFCVLIADVSLFGASGGGPRGFRLSTPYGSSTVVNLLTMVLAITAAVLAMLPATKRWCRARLGSVATPPQPYR